MIRRTFALRALPGRREAVDAALKALAEEMRAAAARLRVENFSIWAAEDMVYGYGEYPDDWTDSTAEAEAREDDFFDAEQDPLFETRPTRRRDRGDDLFDIDEENWS